MAMATNEDAQSANDSTDLWTKKIFSLTQSELNTVAAFRDNLRAYGSKLARYLADVCEGSAAGSFVRADVSELEKLIVAGYGKRNCLEPLRILDKVIFKLNCLYEKSIPQPRKPQLREKQRSIFFEGNTEAHRSGAIWLQAEERWIESCCGWPQRDQVLSTQPPKTITWEMVVVSAALHCGILDLKSAVALVDALCDPPKFFACSRYRGYADLIIQSGKGMNPVSRRWYPDDRLLLLISRVEPTTVRAAVANCGISGSGKRNPRIGQLLHAGILAELKSQNVDPEYCPASFSGFLSKVEQTLRSEIPAVLVNYASGKLDTRSLVAQSIGRINGDPVSPEALKSVPPEIKLDEDDDLVEAFAKGYEDDGSLDRAPQWLQGLRGALKCTTELEINETLLCLLNSMSDIPPVGKQLISLTQKLLSSEASTGNRWAVSSVECCILTVARRFAIYRGQQDPASYSFETLQEIYIEARDNVVGDSKTPAQLERKVSWALREYQRHLVCAYGAAPVNETIAFGVAHGKASIDARVISLDELFEIIKYIQTVPHERWLPKHREFAIAEAVLAYMGGLRRSEGLGLEPDDYIHSMVGQLLVRENTNRGLKTANARRAIQLAVVAHPFSELIGHVAVLFAGTDQKTTSAFENISEDVIIPIIHEAMQQVTGDEGCHLHSLRHSFGHWTFFRLMLSQLSEIPNLFPHLPLMTRWLRVSKEFRYLLYRNDLVDNDHAWAIACMLGHSNPIDVTIPHYVHCFDLLLALFLKKNLVVGKVTDELLRKASGLPKSTAYNRLPSDKSKGKPNVQHGNDAPTVGAGEEQREVRRSSFAQELFRERLGLSVLTASEVNVQPGPQISWIHATRDVLFLEGALHMSLPDVAVTLGLDLATVTAIVQRAATIGKSQSQDGPNEVQCLPRHYRPVPPRGDTARRFIGQFAAEIGEYVGLQPANPNDALDYVVQHLLPECVRVAFIMPDPEMTRKCLSLFYALGFPLKKVQGFSCDGSTSSAPTRKWLKDWGVSWRCNVANQFGRERILKTPAEWLVLEPILSDDNDGEQQGNAQMRALRYVLVMAAIRFGK